MAVLALWQFLMVPKKKRKERLSAISGPEGDPCSDKQFSTPQEMK